MLTGRYSVCRPSRPSRARNSSRETRRGCHQTFICADCASGLCCAEVQPSKTHGRPLSVESEDSELSKLQRAAAFMAEVRLAQAGRAGKLRGNNYLEPEQERAITEALGNSARSEERRVGK